MGIEQKHCLISGRVQGVSYRYSARQQAYKLGITGWVRNRPDGRVELVIQGQTEQMKDMLDWAYQGPQFADVTTIVIKEQSPDVIYTEFEIR